MERLSVRKRLVRSLLCPAVDRTAVCGLCCAGAGAVSLHDEVAVRGGPAPIELREMLAAVAGSVMDTGALPETLCVACAGAAAASYSFLQLCRAHARMLGSVAELVQTGAELPARVYRPGAHSLFLLLEPNEQTVFIDRTDRIVSTKEALSRLKFALKRKSMQCDNCSKTFSVKCNIEKHLRCCRGPPHRSALTCDVSDCYKTFPKRSLLRLHHMRAHEEKKHPCSSCDKKFGSPALVEEHVRAKHQHRECRVCRKVFLGRKSLWVHERTHADPVDSEEDAASDRRTENKIICDVCGQMFARLAPLRRHLVSKHDFPAAPGAPPPRPRLYVCPVCGFTSRRLASVRVHGERIHSLGRRSYVCAQCGRGFHTSSDLTRHRITHTRARPERCERCDKRFVNKAALLYHTRLHTGERPYECAQCGERFLSASRRGAHVRSKHGPRFQCPYCSSTYTERHVMRKHIRKVHGKETIDR